MGASRSRAAPKEAKAAYKVRDVGLAEAGRSAIRLAEGEMPGLMAMRAKYGERQPLKGARIAGCLHLTVEAAVLVETLQALGAAVQWCSSGVFSTQDHAAAALAAAGVPVYAWKGQTDEEFLWCIDQVLVFPDGQPLNMVVDKGGDLTNYLHDRKAELLDGIRGLSEGQGSTGILNLRRMLEEKLLMIPAIDLTSAVTKNRFDSFYGVRESLVDGLRRATGFLLGGKVAVVAGFGHVGKGAAMALRGQGCRVLVTEVDPICALQATMQGYEVTTMELAAPRAALFVTATGCKDVLRQEHFLAMREGAVVCNVGNMDGELDMAWLDRAASERLGAQSPGGRREALGQVGRYRLPNGRHVLVVAEGHPVNLACAYGHPSFAMSVSLTNVVIAQTELWTKAEAFPVGVHRLSRAADEEVAALHLPKLRVTLTRLTDAQALYLRLPKDGPFKPTNYRY